MKYILIAITLSGCASNLPPVKADKKHIHTHSTSLFKDYTSYKPVEAGDWRALNRRVAPQ
jgi:hypothetical protein